MSVVLPAPRNPPSMMKRAVIKPVSGCIARRAGRSLRLVPIVGLRTAFAAAEPLPQALAKRGGGHGMKQVGRDETGTAVIEVLVQHVHFPERPVGVRHPELRL